RRPAATTEYAGHIVTRDHVPHVRGLLDDLELVARVRAEDGLAVLLHQNRAAGAPEPGQVGDVAGIGHKQRVGADRLQRGTDVPTPGGESSGHSRIPRPLGSRPSEIAAYA